MVVSQVGCHAVAVRSIYILALCWHENASRYETHLYSPDKKARFFAGTFKSRVHDGHYYGQALERNDAAYGGTSTHWQVLNSTDKRLNSVAELRSHRQVCPWRHILQLSHWCNWRNSCNWLNNVQKRASSCYITVFSKIISSLNFIHLNPSTNNLFSQTHWRFRSSGYDMSLDEQFPNFRKVVVSSSSASSSPVVCRWSST
jgi:hypothetical protein